MQWLVHTMSVPKWGDDELRQLAPGGFAFDSIGLRGREERGDNERNPVCCGRLVVDRCM